MRYLALSAALALLVIGSAPAFAASRFSLTLDPVAYDNSTRDIVQGQGEVNATLDGNKLTVSGTFSGLSSPATAARLGLGLDYGVPATSFFADLTPSNAEAGTIAGTLTLTPEQVAGLNRRGLFLQLNTVRGTEGSLWGWFAPVGSAK